MPTDLLASWLLTFPLHSTLLAGAALLAARLIRRPEARAVVLRGALLGGVATATFVSVIGLGPSIGVARDEASRGRTIALRVDGDANGSAARTPSRPERQAPAAPGRSADTHDLTRASAASTLPAPSRSLELSLAFALIAAVTLGAARFLHQTRSAHARLARRRPLQRTPEHATHNLRVAALLTELDAPGTYTSPSRASWTSRSLTVARSSSCPSAPSSTSTTTSSARSSPTSSRTSRGGTRSGSAPRVSSAP